MTYLEKFRQNFPDRCISDDEIIEKYCICIVDGNYFEHSKCTNRNCDECWRNEFHGVKLTEVINELDRTDTLDEIAEAIREACNWLVKLGVDVHEARRLIINIAMNTLKEKAFGGEKK